MSHPCIVGQAGILENTFAILEPLDVINIREGRLSSLHLSQPTIVKANLLRCPVPRTTCFANRKICTDREKMKTNLENYLVCPVALAVLPKVCLCSGRPKQNKPCVQVDTTVLGCSPEEAKRKPFIASMGIYVFKRSVLLNHLGEKTDHMDFGSDVIPSSSAQGVPRYP
jgi:hypothetical protein